MGQGRRRAPAERERALGERERLAVAAGGVQRPRVRVGGDPTTVPAATARRPERTARAAVAVVGLEQHVRGVRRDAGRAASDRAARATLERRVRLGRRGRRRRAASARPRSDGRSRRATSLGVPAQRDVRSRPAPARRGRRGGAGRCRRARRRRARPPGGVRARHVAGVERDACPVGAGEGRLRRRRGVRPRHGRIRARARGGVAAQLRLVREPA